jgi:hypothetical protein
MKIARVALARRLAEIVPEIVYQVWKQDIDFVTLVREPGETRLAVWTAPWAIPEHKRTHYSTVDRARTSPRKLPPTKAKVSQCRLCSWRGGGKAPGSPIALWHWRHLQTRSLHLTPFG